MQRLLDFLVFAAEVLLLLLEGYVLLLETGQLLLQTLELLFDLLKVQKVSMSLFREFFGTGTYLDLFLRLIIRSLCLFKVLSDMSLTFALFFQSVLCEFQVVTTFTDNLIDSPSVVLVELGAGYGKLILVSEVSFGFLFARLAEKSSGTFINGHLQQTVTNLKNGLLVLDDFDTIEGMGPLIIVLFDFFVGLLQRLFESVCSDDVLQILKQAILMLRSAFGFHKRDGLYLTL